MKHHIFRTAWAGILALSVCATLSSNVIAASREDTLVIVSGASVNSMDIMRVEQKDNVRRTERIKN